MEFYGSMKLFVLVYLAGRETRKKTNRKCEERKESVPNNWCVFFWCVGQMIFGGKREQLHVRDGKRLAVMVMMMMEYLLPDSWWKVSCK